MLNSNITVGRVCFTCVPMVDQNTGAVEWEPHKTQIHYWTYAGGNYYINDHHCSLYFEDYEEAFDFCAILTEHQST